jgi:hypothetical protein
VNERNTRIGMNYSLRARPNIQMEPSRQPARAIMSPRRAAHLARWADRNYNET